MIAFFKKNTALLKDSPFLRSYFNFSLGPWISAIIAFLTTPIITWLLLPLEFGKASMFTLAYNLTMQIALLGGDQSFVRIFFEKDQAHRSCLLWQCMTMPIVLSIFISFNLLFIKERVSIVLFGEKEQTLAVAVLSFTIILGVFDRFASLVLRMKKKGMLFSSTRILHAITSTGIIIIYAYFISPTFHAIIFGTAAANIITLAFSISLERAFWIPRFNYTIDEIKAILRFGIPFVPTFIVVWLFQSMDYMALRHYSTFSEIGIYIAAFKLVAVLTLLQAGFATFWHPHAFEEYERSPTSVLLFKKTFDTISFFMFLVAGSAIFFKDFLIFILASAYRDATYVMPFLVFQPLMYTVSEVTVCGINFKKKTYWHLWIAIACAILNFTGNTLLVPIYGARGAAFSTGGAYILFFFLRTFISQGLYPVPYCLLRFYLLTLLLMGEAFVATFKDMHIFSMSASLFFLLVVIFSYRKEIMQMLP